MSAVSESECTDLTDKKEREITNDTTWQTEVIRDSTNNEPTYEPAEDFILAVDRLMMHSLMQSRRRDKREGDASDTTYKTDEEDLAILDKYFNDPQHKWRDELKEFASARI